MSDNMENRIKALFALAEDHDRIAASARDAIRGPDSMSLKDHERAAKTIRAAPADAIAARDAMIAAAEARALDSVTTLHTVIADIRAATVGSKPMLSELAQALVAWRDEAVAKEREACAMVAGDWQNETGTDIAASARICPHIAAAIRKRGEG